jgi:hypothetical protein
MPDDLCPVAFLIIRTFFFSMDLTEVISLDTARNNSEYAIDEASPSMVEKNTLIWGFFLVGVVIGFVAVYIVVAQPIFAQLGQMQRQMADLETNMEQLVGARNQAWEAGHLLSDLKGLKSQIRDARASLREMRNLRKDLIEEAQNSAAAADALAKLSRLQDFALEQQDMTNSARESLAEMAEIQQRLVGEHAGTPSAEETLADLDRVRHDLTELLSLKAQIAEHATDMAAARSTACELLSLKDQIVANSQNTEAARSSANRLFVLQDELKTHGEEMSGAFSSLDRLVEIKDKLVDQTPAVADAVQNLEILSDFRDELGAQIRSLTQMREGLLQIVLMENTLGRVAKLLEPLSQISNVRRLSDQELRAAARSILDSRSTRLSSKPELPQQIPQEAAMDPFSVSENNSNVYEGESGTVPPPVPLPVTTYQAAP